MTRRDIRTGCAMLAVLALTACGSDGSFDPDLRGLIGGMDTAPAAAAAAPRPAPVTLNHYSRQDTATMDTFTNNNDKEGDDDDDNDDDDDGNDDDDEIEASQIPIRPKKRRTVDR